MAHHFPSSTTIGTERCFRALAGGADALSVARGTINLSIHTVAAGNGLPFISGIGVNWIRDGYTVLTNAFKDISHLFIHRVSQVIGASLRNRLLLAWFPVAAVASSQAGGAAS